MIKEFEITNIGLMSYYLGIKIKQWEDKIFMNQEVCNRGSQKIQDGGLWKTKYFGWVWSEDVKEW